MKTLLFDAGNTRFKWALLRDGSIGAQQATPRTELAALERWLRRAPEVERVVGVNVAGAGLQRALAALLEHAGRPEPEFITASETAAGVRNVYAQPALLGADRWAAMVAAHQLAGTRRPACAVAIGTALTLDLVDATGAHRGGLIAPGPQLMLDALLGRTADIADRAAQDPPERGRTSQLAPLGRSTREAVDAGCLVSAAGLIDYSMAELARGLDQRPALFITGGASEAVVPLLQSTATVVPELVLRGVALLAGVPVRQRS